MEIIAGVDEAGRGPLAGPVCAAAVILPDDHGIIGLADSKKMTARNREKVFEEIQRQARAIGIGWVGESEIDRLNILQATYKAMQMALGRLAIRPDWALVDGYGLPTQIIPNQGIIGGDAKVDCIKAASIVAKVSRDRHMLELDRIFPEYGFAQHKGYGTPQHLTALKEYLATPIHRRSFRPVPDYLPTIGWLRKQRRIGWWGERLACLELLKQGLSITATNIICGNHGELDIIAETATEIVFVEVKTITREQLGTPEQKVDRTKLNRIQHAIEYYLMENNSAKNLRLDVITVRLGQGAPRLQHYRGIRLD
ncbi:MAG: ribonuclease HII [Candidatus Neomarinimicrobiota bacterium]